MALGYEDGEGTIIFVGLRFVTHGCMTTSVGFFSADEASILVSAMSGMKVGALLLRCDNSPMGVGRAGDCGFSFWKLSMSLSYAVLAARSGIGSPHPSRVNSGGDMPVNQ